MLKKTFAVQIYKSKLNEKTLIDIIPLLSKKSIKFLQRDLFNIENSSDTSSSDNDNDNNVLNKKNTSNIEKIKLNADKDENVYIFTDGNCKNNGKKNALGGYGVFFTTDKDSIYYKWNTVKKVENATNQKAELSAFKKLFEILSENTETFKNKKVYICSDSMYSINCVSKWYVSWLKNNWKTSKGEPVKNLDIIKDIIKYKEQIDSKLKYEFKHVMSHTVEPSKENVVKYKMWYGNKMVDDMINVYLEQL